MRENKIKLSSGCSGCVTIIFGQNSRIDAKSSFLFSSTLTKIWVGRSAAILCSLMCYYEIKPLFIFDGIPSHLKNNELRLRKMKKEEAKKKFDKLKDKLSGKRIEKLKR